MESKNLVACIIKCLTQLLQEDELTADSRESLEVAIQCLESSYGIHASDAGEHFNIIELYKSETKSSEPTVEDRMEAEVLKNKGNTLMKIEKYNDALDSYSMAIKLDSYNAVYYCNRAAVHSKLGNHVQAINDCNKALSIDPAYSKAYGRLGLAYSSLNKYKEAKESYQKALELEPDNESLKNNLQIAEEKLNQQNNASFGMSAVSSSIPNMDLSSLLSNPALMNMARQMLSDPSMQSMVSNLMTGNTDQGGRMEALIEAGQNLAQQMQNANPELIDSLRRQMGGNPNCPESSEKKEL